jgi:hypothetical protein
MYVLPLSLLKPRAYAINDICLRFTAGRVLARFWHFKFAHDKEVYNWAKRDFHNA